MNDTYLPDGPASVSPDGLPAQRDGEPIRTLRDLQLSINVRWATAKAHVAEVSAADDGPDECTKVIARRDALFEVAVLLDDCHDVTGALERLVEMTAAVVNVRAVAETGGLEWIRAGEMEDVYEDVAETLRGMRGAR
jgi:hypothetical protein